MNLMDQVLKRVDSNIDASVERLFELIKIKSISTDPEYKDDCRSAAEWLSRNLVEIGFEAQVRETDGHPMVLGHFRGKVEDDRRALFYGHYDVQPVDPVELWDGDPFAPKIETREGTKVICGRGTADDKGQLMTLVEAARAWIAETGGLPINLTILLEGEEETGSPSLLPFLESNREELSCDFAMVCDTGMWDPQTPAMTIMLRGMMAEEIELTAANRDLHSGHYGGAARNPIHLLCDILSGLHDENGKVVLPGFYDGVSELPKDVSDIWQKLDFSESGFLNPIGLQQPAGESDRSVLEQIWARPTLEINGVTGGYSGVGLKTVIPSKASAKISCRLVGDQDPDEIRVALREFVEQRLPSDCSVNFQDLASGPGLWVDIESREFNCAREALSQEWDRDAVLIGCGGSIPIVNEFKQRLGMETILIGFGLDDDQIHSPNEKYNFSSFHKGIRSWARVLEKISDTGS